MAHSIYQPILPDVGPEKRKSVQENFGRHLAEQRNRMAILVRKWIETDTKHPTPIHDRVIDRVRRLDAATRADVARVALLMADEIVSAVLAAFAGGDEMQFEGKSVNYAIIAQVRESASHEIVEEVDVNRGTPIIAIWDEYKRWVSRYEAKKGG